MKEIMTYAWGLIKRLGFSMSDNRKYNADIQTYFDTEKGEWRCFKKVNLSSVNL